jgi:hypothetical protein
VDYGGEAGEVPVSRQRACVAESPARRMSHPRRVSRPVFPAMHYPQYPLVPHSGSPGGRDSAPSPATTDHADAGSDGPRTEAGAGLDAAGDGGEAATVQAAGDGDAGAGAGMKTVC